MTIRAALPGEVARTGAVRVALPPEQALDLFTAQGEIHWAPGWKPRFVSPPDGAPVPGGIWLTGEGGEEVIWRVERFDRSTGEAEYLRITPGNRVVVVHVHCARDGIQTLATITYRAIALSAAGQRWIEDFTAEKYGEMMKEWERLIAAYLATRR